MLIYWGCGEHIERRAADDDRLFEDARRARFRRGWRRWRTWRTCNRGRSSAPGFGRWPNERDRRPVPVSGSLIGAHKVQANYAPAIAFSLGAGQDFMPALGLREAGALPSGASRLEWQPADSATGYALTMFGSNGSGDVIMWSSAKSAQMPAMDYLAPGEVKRLVAAGAVLRALDEPVRASRRSRIRLAAGHGDDDRLRPRGRLLGQAQASDLDDQGAIQDHRVADARNGRDDGQCGRSRRAGPGSTQQQPKKRRGIGIGDILGAIPH